MANCLLTAGDMRRTLGRMAHEILEKNKGAENLVVIGILKRGFPVAKRLAFHMSQIEGIGIPCGSLDVTPYRDDLAQPPAPEASEIPFSVTGKRVVLVDEVIQTGRTVRAALDALIHHGRPAEIQLAVLLDRGGRELPIQPNYVGMTTEVAHEDYIEVRFAEVDGEDGVFIRKGA
ncbi:MAG: bifunctional pyr operon transcriptional regulator/uracil phosphoribosyltransferase PyrR [Fimbriimonadales bacterium]|nr:bifunctional pyr operon transcriptional regulator/uracil phosphoribosyltransferase PyrR [Fimbriimonadales bacterium]